MCDVNKGIQMKYRHFFYLSIVLVALGGCGSRVAYRDPFQFPQIEWKPDTILNAPQADRILGTPSRLEKTTAYAENGKRVFQSVFFDVAVDPVTGKKGALYFMVEEYPTSEAVLSYLNPMLRENHVNPDDGIPVEGGARLHYMAGGQVIRMVVIPKGNRLLRLKVNVVTSRYRLDEFRKVAEELAKRLVVPQ